MMSERQSSANLSNNTPLLGGSPSQSVDNNVGDPAQRGYDGQRSSKGKKRWLILAIAIGIVILVFLAVFLPVYFVVIRKSPESESSSSGPSAAPGASGTTNGPTPSGTAASTVRSPSANLYVD